MTILLLLFASLALVALIGAALVYAVHRLISWSVDRVEARQRATSAGATAPSSTTPNARRDADSDADLESSPAA